MVNPNQAGARNSHDPTPSRVLLIVGEPGDLVLVSRALRREHVPVQLKRASTGREALEALARIQPGTRVDLLYVDIKWVDVVKRMTANAAVQPAKSILLVASCDWATASRALVLRVDAVFKKPFAFKGWREIACAIGKLISSSWAGLGPVALGVFQEAVEVV